MQTAATGVAGVPALRRVLDGALYLIELAVVGVCYFGLAQSAQVLPAINPTATPLWPPTGLALALFLLRGFRLWPAILAGSVAAMAWAGRSLLAADCVGIGTVLAALLGAWLLIRWSNGRHTFATPAGIARFVVVSFATTALIASVFATAGAVLGADVGLAHPVAAWVRMWLADAAGSLLIAPFVVFWAILPGRPGSWWSVPEAVVIFFLAGVIGFAAFAPPVAGNLIGYDIDGVLPYRSLLGFLVVLPLVWAGLRGNQRNAATAALIFCAFAIWGFSAAARPFANADVSESLLLLLALVLGTTVPPLVLAAELAAYRTSESQLLAARDRLYSHIDTVNEELDSARRHFQILIEGVVDYAIFMLDTAGRVASWNSAAQQIIGYAEDEIIGKHFGIFYRPDERRAGEPTRALELTIQNGKHEIEGWRIRKNGTLLFVTGSITAIRDDKENLVGFANVLRDATERRDAQEKLVQAREQLAMAQKMEAIGKLTGGIAHDFNNLLMIIGGNAQTFRRLLDPKLPRAIEAIQTAAKRGESLTRQLLTFSRRQHLSPTVVDLNASIRNMRTMIESSLRGNIVYEENVGEGIWPVKVDLAELELAIVNIAVNARDAMPNGGTFTLSVNNIKGGREIEGGGLRGDFAAIEFRDTGMGIPPDLLSKVFDPFFTTKEVGKGTGLGLSQVYGFAHQAGGTVKATSKIGQGTIITIYLPSTTETEIADKDVSSPDEAQTQRPTALVVDDSAEVAEVTSSLFEHLGYQTVYRDSAEAALKLLSDGMKIDLVFSDIVMPGTIDGVGLASEIRARYPELPVLLTTGYSDAAQAVPPDLRILRKPFDADALKGFIQNTVEAGSLH